MIQVEQDDLSIYSIFNSHETSATTSSGGSSSGHQQQQLADSSSTFSNSSAIYPHHNYSPTPHCMYEHQFNIYSLPTEHQQQQLQQQQGSLVTSYPWWHNNRAVAATPTAITASNNNSATHLHRTYPYGNSNYVPLHQQQQQSISISPTDERSSSAQSYVSSPSCTSIQSPVISPANAAASNNFAAYNNSNSNSPVAHQSTNQALGQQQSTNFQELYSSVCRFLNSMHKTKEKHELNNNHTFVFFF